MTLDRGFWYRVAGSEIRTMHTYGFRSGQWARVIGVREFNGRDCWAVYFPDGVEDLWVMDDAAADYEFRCSS